MDPYGSTTRRSKPILSVPVCSVCFRLNVCVSTITGKLPVLELALLFPVTTITIPKVANPISGTAFTVHFFLFIARVPVYS